MLKIKKKTLITSIDMLIIKTSRKS